MNILIVVYTRRIWEIVISLVNKTDHTGQHNLKKDQPDPTLYICNATYC